MPLGIVAFRHYYLEIMMNDTAKEAAQKFMALLLRVHEQTREYEDEDEEAFPEDPVEYDDIDLYD